ncbi:uncharacterized protein [Haliotis cracherodii]|uniref:uncharacterized protein n=1 Tax=Haliotis cracherodii TaxID=6455 RepID=UPI0039E8515B
MVTDRPDLGHVSPVSDDIDHPVSRIRSLSLLHLPPCDELPELPERYLINTFHSYMSNINFLCERQLRMGGLGEDGWDVCDDDRPRPAPPCLVYSVGTSLGSTFDDDVRRLYRCDVVALRSHPVEHYRRAPGLTVMRAGLGVVYTGNRWEFLTLRTLRGRLNQTHRTLDILKIDSHDEDNMAFELLVTARDLSHVRQLLIEFRGRPSTTSTLLRRLKVMRKIHDAGFRKFSVQAKKNCSYTEPSLPYEVTGCYKMHLVNTNSGDFQRT